jgi:hypothetical protein
MSRPPPPPQPKDPKDPSRPKRQARNLEPAKRRRGARKTAGGSEAGQRRTKKPLEQANRREGRQTKRTRGKHIKRTLFNPGR